MESSQTKIPRDPNAVVQLITEELDKRGGYAIPPVEVVGEMTIEAETVTERYAMKMDEV
jgi:DUF1009 family protein